MSKSESPTRDEFVDALKDGEEEEGLKKAFQVLKKRGGGPTALVRDVDLLRAVSPEIISVEKAREIIQQLNQQGLFSCEEFVHIVKVIKCLMKKKKKEGFNILRKERSTVGAEDVQLALTIRDTEGVLKNAKQTIQQLNKQPSFNLNEFLHTFTLLEEPGEADQMMKIYKKLVGMKEREMLTLYGKAEVGKTWTAREVANLAVRKRDFDAAIWLYLNRSYEDEMSLLTSIAYQLSLLADFDEFVAQEEKKNAEATKKKEPGMEEKLPQKEEVDHKKELEDKKRGRIIDLIVKNMEGKKILFIRDSDGDGSRTKIEIKTKMKKMHDKEKKDKSGDEKKKDEGGEKKKKDEDENKDKEEKKDEDENKDKGEKKDGGEKSNLNETKEVVFLKLSGAGAEENEDIELGVLKSYKVLATTNANEPAGENGVMVKPFTWDKSKSLADRVGEGVEEKNREEVKELARYFMFRSNRLPSQILLISRIVSYHGKKEAELGLQKLRNDRDAIKKGEGGVEELFNVLIKGYEERLPKSVLIDCYGPEKPETHFMRRGRAVSFNEVICYWIMEGHLGHFHRIDEAYHKGHRVLMELMDCGLLQKQEADLVTPGRATTFKFHINDYKEFFSCIRPGIGLTFDMRLGRVALADGMIRTTNNSNWDEQIISTLLLDGKRISEEERPTESLSKHKDLVQILAISDPTTQHFKLPILEMHQLRLLALRGCQFLNNLEHFLEEKEQSPDVETKSYPEKKMQISQKLEGLTVVEISGPNSQIKTVPDHLFTLIPNLKTVNLSHLRQIKSLPPTFYRLAHVEFLILRGCESLQELSTLKYFKDLKILDVSGSISFEKFEDKSLHTNTKLQILNLSKTKLKTLPLINQLKELKFVWLRDCHELPRIRKIDRMENLQIFDISGAGEVERFCDPSLEDLKNLTIIDISRTKIRRLPANLGDPMYLYAKDCLKLRVVPPVEELKRLQDLDLSGCIHLKEVRKEFFTNVNGLTDLNLSKTKVQHLPFLGDLVTLRRLSLSECKHLEEVEKLSCLKELESLDISGCEKVMELEEGTFDKMKHLKHLNLSGTGIGGHQKPLPSLSKLESLEMLHVRECPNLTALPGVEQVSTLELVDYSGTVLESPPCFSKNHPPHKRRRVLGAGIESIDSSQLFKNLDAVKGDDEAQARRWDFKQEEVTQCKWIISNWRVGVAEAEVEKLGTPVYGVHFLRLLEEYPLFLTQNLNKFCFLVYPSQTGASVEDRFSKESYIDELSLREIYLEQVCEEKMERCFEIREFKELPESLRPLIAQAQLVVLVDDPFLKSLFDLRINSTMPMKACWIESCTELEHAVAAPVKVEEKTGEAGQSEGEKGKNEVELPKGGKKNGEKASEATTDGKTSELAKAGEPAKGQGNEPTNVSAGESAGESGKGQGHQQKDSASAEPSKGEGDQQNTVDAAKSGGGQLTATAAEEKPEEPAKNEVNQPENVVADNSGESSKGEGDQQSKPGDATAAVGGDEQKNTDAEEKSGVAAKSEGNQQKTTGAVEKSGETAKNEGDQAKNGGKEEKSGEEAKNPDEDLKNLETLWICDAWKMKSVCEGVSLKFLKSLYLEFCPQLSSICNSYLQLQNLETLFVKYCPNMKSVFNEENESKMEKLRQLQLWGLDKLQKINCKAPLLRKLRVGECPLLEHLIASRLEDTEAKEHENEGHKCLEILHIKSCDNLKSIFEYDDDVIFESLTELELSGLPKLKKVAREALALKVLRVADCPSLRSVIAGASRDLETLEVKACDKMEAIIAGQGSNKLEKMKKIELLGLPELKTVGAELPTNLGNQKYWACPKLERILGVPSSEGAPNQE